MIKNKMTFEEAISIGYNSNSHPQGIGEYKEKTMHAVFKNYYESDVSKQEVKVGKFYADILNEYGIIEIQTRNFNAMRDKLAYFLDISEVTVVYPLVYNKYINWVNSSDEKDYMKKSPRHDNLFKAAKELYKIKAFLNNPKLHFVFVFCDMIELKNLDGWNKTKKKGSSSLNKIPTSVNYTIEIENYKDFLKYVNLDNLNDDGIFDRDDFKKDNKCSLRDASLMLTIFNYLGLVSVVGKKGRKHLYKFTQV